MPVEMRYKWYIDYDEENCTYDVWEEEGGHEHGLLYDKLLCECHSKELAEKIINMLIEESCTAISNQKIKTTKLTK